jgi:hypothetical protein
MNIAIHCCAWSLVPGADILPSGAELFAPAAA